MAIADIPGNTQVAGVVRMTREAVQARAALPEWSELSSGIEKPACCVGVILC